MKFHYLFVIEFLFIAIVIRDYILNDWKFFEID